MLDVSQQSSKTTTERYLTYSRTAFSQVELSTEEAI